MSDLAKEESQSTVSRNSTTNAVGDGSGAGQSMDGNTVNPADFVSTLQNTFQSMQDRFTEMMDKVMERMDEMADRLNELEKEVTDLVNYAGNISDQPNKDTENVPPGGGNMSE
ncbi:hypothetical protein BV898_13657 [Hypsibius exemplaris]|uniref:Heat shock factor-binding protein 1 n=1 Tax=Hypsibius exemplaris TaxID=2072580 RepID=A0A1W0WA58_HYPEX|nr:hypothetical protein BV898_13657 [Hypsibius exemplaris]